MTNIMEGIPAAADPQDMMQSLEQPEAGQPEGKDTVHLQRAAWVMQGEF